MPTGSAPQPRRRRPRPARCRSAAPWWRAPGTAPRTPLRCAPGSPRERRVRRRHRNVRLDRAARRDRPARKVWMVLLNIAVTVIVPVDTQRMAARCPATRIGHHGRSIGQATTGARPSCPRSNSRRQFERALEHRTLHDGGVEQSGQPHVDAVDRLARTLLGEIETPARRNRELPIAGIFQRIPAAQAWPHRRRRRRTSRCGRSAVRDDTVACRALRLRHTPSAAAAAISMSSAASPAERR